MESLETLKTQRRLIEKKIKQYDILQQIKNYTKGVYKTAHIFTEPYYQGDDQIFFSYRGEVGDLTILSERINNIGWHIFGVAKIGDTTNVWLKKFK